MKKSNKLIIEREKEITYNEKKYMVQWCIGELVSDTTRINTRYHFMRILEKIETTRKFFKTPMVKYKYVWSAETGEIREYYLKHFFDNINEENVYIYEIKSLFCMWEKEKKDLLEAEQRKREREQIEYNKEKLLDTWNGIIA